MPIVGFNFTKVYVEKKIITDISTKFNIRNNVLITDLKEEKLPTGKTKANGLRFDFKYTLNYEPSIGDIELVGFIYFLDDSDIVKGILNSWKKDKKIPQDITAQIINTILFKANIKALGLAQEVNLPPHLPMPRVNPEAKPESYIG